MPETDRAPEVEPYWSAPRAKLYLGDVRDCLRALPDESAHCCVTSPPYWGLRDYGTGTWEGGDPACDHKKPQTDLPKDPTSTLSGRATNQNHEREPWSKNTCGKCGARRIDQQLGSEPSPDCGTQGQAQCGQCFVCNMVAVFREVRRVLRDDGTLWLNLGDTYGGGPPGGFSEKQWSNAGSHGARRGSGSLPSGNLIGVPWRVALALQADGWILRQDIIWYAPNKMPESVTNRCTKSHEYIFLLAKGMEYYFDALAIAEAGKCGVLPRLHANGEGVDETKASGGKQQAGSDGLVNKRDVWVVPTQGYPGAHFAAYSPRLIAPCILAGTSERGCCARCGAPYERLVAKDGGSDRTKVNGISLGGDAGYDGHRTRAGLVALREYGGALPTKTTVGWRKSCGCRTQDIAPCVVLDPFVGSGTTVATALELGRAGVGIDLSEDYLRTCAIPRIEKLLDSADLAQRTGYVPPPDKPRQPKKLE